MATNPNITVEVATDSDHSTAEVLDDLQASAEPEVGISGNVDELVISGKVDEPVLNEKIHKPDYENIENTVFNNRKQKERKPKRPKDKSKPRRPKDKSKSKRSKHKTGDSESSQPASGNKYVALSDSDSEDERDREYEMINTSITKTNDKVKKCSKKRHLSKLIRWGQFYFIVT